MKVLIIEDEIAAQEHLVRMLNQVAPGMEILARLSAVQQATGWLATHPAPDLIFLDIELSDGSSFQLFEAMEIKVPIIFTTAYHEYALQAFDHHSIAYLLKPITAAKLKTALDKLTAMRQQMQPSLSDIWPSLQQAIQPDNPQYRDRFLVRLGSSLMPISTEEVAYFYRDTLVYLVTKAGKRFPIDFSLEALESQLAPEQFLRLNRQTLARVESIEKVESYLGGKLLAHLCPKLNDAVVVSQEKASWLKERLGG